MKFISCFLFVLLCCLSFAQRFPRQDSNSDVDFKPPSDLPYYYDDYDEFRPPRDSGDHQGPPRGNRPCPPPQDNDDSQDTYIPEDGNGECPPPQPEQPETYEATNQKTAEMPSEYGEQDDYQQQRPPRDENQDPPQEGNQDPPEDDGERPPRHGNYGEPRDGNQYPPEDENEQIPPEDDAEQPPRRGNHGAPRGGDQEAPQEVPEY